MACRKINKDKIRIALKCSEDWVKGAEERGAKETFKMGNDTGFSILWCEKRNITKYKEMLNLDYYLELEELKELYNAI